MEEVEIKPHDFIEIEYTGFTDGKIFDTTKKIVGVNEKAKPLKICVGLGMVVKGLDKIFVGKKEKKFKVKLKPEEAFGKRNPDLVRTFSASRFKDKSMLREGMILNIDGLLAKVIRSASGRVILDFNHPLAGKYVNYDIEIVKKITGNEEKIKTIIDWELKDINIKYNLKEDKENKRFNVYLEGDVPDKAIDLTKEIIKDIIGVDITITKL